MHHTFIIHEIVEDPQNLRNLLVLGLLRILRHAHLEVHLLLQRFGVKLVKEGRLVVLAHIDRKSVV